MYSYYVWDCLCTIGILSDRFFLQKFVKYDFLIIGSKPRSKPKKEKTKEEKTFRKRAKYFVVTQLVSVLLFLTFMNKSDDEVELDDDEGYGYDD